VRDIVIWKMSCANSEGAAVKKGEEDHRRIFSVKKEREK
jgi:hypothetical protein